MTSIQQQDRQQSQRLKRNIKRLIHDQLHSINPWWLISFHYRDHHSPPGSGKMSPLSFVYPGA